MAGIQGLDEVNVPVALGGGLDTKTDPKALNAGKLLQLQNGIFTAPNQIRKRNGYNALTQALSNSSNTGQSTLPYPLIWNKSFNETLLAGDGYNAYAFSPTLQAWGLVGNYTSVALDEFTVNPFGAAGITCDCAILNNYILYVYQTSGGHQAAVYDLTTNTFLGYCYTGPGVVGSSLPRAAVLGGATLAIFYVNISGALECDTVTVSAAIIQINTTATTAITSGAPYDVIPTASGAYVTYWTTSGGDDYPTIVSLNSSGTFGTPHTISSAGETSPAYGPITASVDGSSNIWLYYYVKNGSPYYAYYTVLSSSYTQLLAPTIIFELATGTPYNLAGQAFGTTGKQFAYASFQTTSGPYETTWFALTSGGSVTTNGAYATGLVLQSNVFAVGEVDYALFLYPQAATGTALQPTFFVVALSDDTLGGGYGLKRGYPVARVFTQTASISATATKFSPNAYSSSVYFCLPQTVASETTQTSGVQYLQQVSAVSVQANFNDPTAYKVLESGQGLVLGGAVPSFYDGIALSELGFNLFPEVVSYTAATTGGQLGAGPYNYVFVFQFQDANGNLHQSEPSAVISVTGGLGASGTGKLTFQVSCAYTTQKNNVVVAGYRTLTAASGGSTYYQFTSFLFQNSTVSSSTGTTVTITDFSVSDAALVNNAQLYTNGGVLPNGPPPPATVIATHNNRLWMVDAESQNTIAYTKTFSPGFGLSPSPFLEIEVDPNRGPITALQEMDTEMVGFKQQIPFFFAGDGPDSTGANSTLTTPQFIPSDAGCDQFKSIVLLPSGILRHTTKGWYLLARSLQDQYFGFDVESYNSQVFTSSVMAPSANQVRILAASGTSLVYDYVMNQWGTLTNHLGQSADAYEGLYTYVRTDGTVYQENPLTFLDSTASYGLTIQTAWIKTASIQGFQRIRRFLLLGDYVVGSAATGWGMASSVAYDYGSTFYSLDTYNPSVSGGSSGILQYRERVTQQKCEAISFLFQEQTVSGASGSFVDLTDLSVEVGIKKGLRKMPLAQTP